MAGERRLNWGADATDAKYRTEHDTANSKFKIAEDLDGNTVLLEWDDTAGEFVYRGPVNLNGQDIIDSGTTVYDASTDTVGDGTTSADHQSVSTEQESIIDKSGNGETRQVVGFDDDSDSSTTLSLSISSIGSYDYIKIVTTVNGNGSGSTSPVDITLNGVTSDYQQETLNSGNISSTTTANSWSFEFFDQNTVKERFLLDSESNQVTIKQQSGGVVARDKILNGATPAVGDVNSVSLSTSFNASGRVHLLGISVQ